MGRKEREAMNTGTSVTTQTKKKGTEGQQKDGEQRLGVLRLGKVGAEGDTSSGR